MQITKIAVIHGFILQVPVMASGQGPNPNAKITCGVIPVSALAGCWSQSPCPGYQMQILHYKRRYLYI